MRVNCQVTLRKKSKIKHYKTSNEIWQNYLSSKIIHSAPVLLTSYLCSLSGFRHMKTTHLKSCALLPPPQRGKLDNAVTKNIFQWDKNLIIDHFPHRPSENMLIRANTDGTYSANWTPGAVGLYTIHVTIDGIEIGMSMCVNFRTACFSSEIFLTQWIEGMHWWPTPLPSDTTLKYCPVNGLVF